MVASSRPWRPAIPTLPAWVHVKGRATIKGGFVLLHACMRKHITQTMLILLTKRITIYLHVVKYISIRDNLALMLVGIRLRLQSI